MTLGEKIKTLRKQRLLEQSELAEKVGVSRQVISSWENNHSIPRDRKLKELSNVLGVDISCLTEDEPFDVFTATVIATFTDDNITMLEERLKLLKSEVNKIERILAILKEET